LADTPASTALLRAAAARHDVDDAREGAGAVEHRPGAAHHLDALDVLEVDAGVVADVRGVEPVVVGGVPVEEDEHAVAVVARAAEAAEARGLVGAVVAEVDAADAAQRLGDGGVAHRAQLLRRDDGDRARRVLDALRGARRGRHLLDAGEGHLDALLRAGAHLDDAVDGAEAGHRDAHAARAHLHVEHGGREAHRAAVDLDEGAGLVGAHQHAAREGRERRAGGDLARARPRRRPRWRSGSPRRR
jgi:hypothetical protein